jgi:PPOX class probable F420-dependent enzyme
MDKAALDTFLGEARIAKLVTLRADGSPTAVPVWFEWDGATATLFTAQTSAKIRRLRADPRVALSVETTVGEPEAWVTLEGIASIEAEGGIELARRLIVRYYSAERAAAVLPGWEKAAGDWVVVRVTPSRIESMG